MNSDRTLNPETLEAQIVVIGGGGAGLTAAVAAAENGVTNIILLEKRRKLGGNTALAHVIFAAESPVQKRLHIDANKDEIFRSAMEYAHWTINPRIVRAFINKSGDTIRWLEEKGIPFEMQGEGRKYMRGQYPLVVHHPGPIGTGYDVIKALAKDGEAMGIKVLCETGAKELLTNDTGKVNGVLATRKDGGDLRIKANSVIIASGGYAGNKKMLRKYCPYYHQNIKLVGIPCMGEGILMAMKIGAATEGLGRLHVEAGAHIPGERAEVYSLAMEPSAISVNKRGERYIDESCFDNVFESAMAIVRQPESVCYTILDEKMIQDIIENGPVAGWVHVRAGVPLPNLANYLQKAAERGHVKISNSLDEIAKWIGAKPEVLKATVDEYNSFCDKGYDDMFIKDRRYLVPLRTPPYYAVTFYPRYLGTIGGIKINEHTQVIDKEDNPIPGLYAAGQDTGGWEPEVYNSISLYAHAFGFALNSGRIAGESAANYISQKYN